MGIINWLMHRSMRARAENLAEWATHSFESVQRENPTIGQRDVFRIMLDRRVNFPGGEADREKVLDRYGSSLHGLCYYLGLNSPEMSKMMVSRCIQFTEYVDIALKDYGAAPLPPEEKKRYFQYLKLPEEAVGVSYL
jgi:hypothetical protein